jgi:hypothetical protein
MVDDEKKSLRNERDQIERSAMTDQFGWKERLAGASAQTREQVLQILLPPPTFERWRMLTTSLSD